jgi:hypothetical protein
MQGKGGHFNSEKCDILQAIKTSVMGTLNMLGLAKRVGARLVDFYSYF